MTVAIHRIDPGLLAAVILSPITRHRHCVLLIKVRERKEERGYSYVHPGYQLQFAALTSSMMTTTFMKPLLGPIAYSATPLRLTLRSTRALHSSLTSQNAASTSTTTPSATSDDVRSKLKAALKTAMKARDKDATGTIKVSSLSRARVQSSPHHRLKRR